MPMEDANDQDPLLLNKVDQPVGADQQLSEAGELRITQPMAAVRE